MMQAPVSPARLEHLASYGAVHLRPVYAVMRSSGTALLLIQQRLGRFDMPTRSGWVALVLDDTDRALGPSAFHSKSMRRLIQAATHIAIIASDIVPGVYATAAGVAAMGLRCLIIETLPEYEAAWLHLVEREAPRTKPLLCTVAEGTA